MEYHLDSKCLNVLLNNLCLPIYSKSLNYKGPWTDTLKSTGL